MILDEVFDSSLDATGTEEFLKIIRYVIKDANIFIISHKNGLEDKFEDHIRFEKHKGFSRDYLMIGIVGNGFVGNAVYQNFRDKTPCKVYDTDKNRSLNTLSEVIEQDFIFVCLPTPMRYGWGSVTYQY